MKYNSIIVAGLFCLFLVGCNLFGTNAPDSRPFFPKPANLNPEADAFTNFSARTYAWKEGWRIGTRDTVISSRFLTATKTGGTNVNGAFILRAHFNADDAKALPTSMMTQLGFNPSKVQLDSAAVAVPDPGPALRFPVTPTVGWRLDTISGDLRFVRQLIGTDVYSQLLGTDTVDMEGWTFAETTYCAETRVVTAKYTMAFNGLLHLYEQRPGFYPDAGDTGSVTLWREITAQ